MLSMSALRSLERITVHVARVVIDIPAKGLSSAFDYDIPQILSPQVEVGVAVLVEFGRRRAVGHVIEVAATSSIAERKPLLAVLSPPRFDSVSAGLAIWIAQEYIAPLSDAIRLLLPSGSVPMAIRDGRSWRLRPPVVSPLQERVVEPVSQSSFTPLPNAHRQRAVLDALSQGPVTVAELTAAFGSVSSVLRRLESAGAIRVTARRRFRGPSAQTLPAPRHKDLSPGQVKALEAISAAGPGDCVLLHGTTGSGKTEVYLRAIEEVLDSGDGALMLVPEISLTPQTVGRFRSRFGDLVAVVHSRLGPGERLDQWDRIASGEARIVVGARSALFSPVRDLGLVIIDEEHETSYKHFSAPRYHTRDVARRLVEKRGATLVLGSATPSLESLHAADQGHIRLVRMPDRVAGGTRPEVEIVDMSLEFCAGNRSMFSRRLAEELRRVASLGDKAILLLNRRGFAAFLLCRECGHVPGCSRCSTSLIFHESGATLMCHHCGERSKAPAACPVCESRYLRRFGAGTQRVATEVASLLPELPIVRMDADTTSLKGGHGQRLAEFEALSSGVLIGTQMVAKGLDYPEVTLVGVVSADTTLHIPDMRSGERTFQMLEQVAGRAGRGEKRGRVIVQTYWPEHPAIRSLALDDPKIFYDRESQERRELRFPPYGRLANVLITADSDAAAQRNARSVAKELRSAVLSQWEVLGPVPAPLARLKDRYRWHVLVKAPSDAAIASVVRTALSRTSSSDEVTVAPDIDPLDLA